MPIPALIHSATGVLILLFFAEFARESYRENKKRAMWVNVIAIVITGILWVGLLFLLESNSLALIIPSLFVALIALLFFLPIRSRNKAELGKADSKYDERDTMFAREEYLPGSHKYNDYYEKHPELKKIDDRIRALPELLGPGGKFYDEFRSNQIEAYFRLIEDLAAKVDGRTAEKETPVDPEKATSMVKQFLLNMGAVEVGVARFDPNHVYSHVGRGPEKWAEPIENNHKHVIAFTLEMAYHQVEKAPLLNITEETVRGYFNGALLSTSLAAAIREIGYPARAHVAGSNYQLIMPAVAHDAGLGELGRFGYLISKKLGARVRLGAVSTDLPLIPDKPVRFGVHEFCQICKKCADNCPSRAIPFDDPVRVRGVLKWPLNMERCITYWRLAGTDCGLCMRVCPFSHPPATVHNLIRKGINNSAIARKISLKGDDLFYGRIIREFILNNPAEP